MTIDLEVCGMVALLVALRAVPQGSLLAAQGRERWNRRDVLDGLLEVPESSLAQANSGSRTCELRCPYRHFGRFWAD